MDHENLDACRAAIEFLALSVQLLEEIPKERRELRRELERAAMSIPLNLAERAGKPSPADRARYHGIARGSATACAALLDVSRIKGVVQSKDVEKGKRLLSRPRLHADQDVPIATCLAHDHDHAIVPWDGLALSLVGRCSHATLGSTH